MGISPQQYLTNLRLEAAHRALRESESSIQEIIAACGLRDKNHFYNLYRQRFGMTAGRIPQTISGAEKGGKHPRRFKTGAWRRID